MQTELKIMGVVGCEIADLPKTWIKSCKTAQSAMRLCILNHPSKAGYDHIAEVLEMRPGSLSRILNSDLNGENRYLGADKIAMLQRECRNRAISQWIDLQTSGEIECM